MLFSGSPITLECSDETVSLRKLIPTTWTTPPCIAKDILLANQYNLCMKIATSMEDRLLDAAKKKLDKTGWCAAFSNVDKICKATDILADVLPVFGFFLAPVKQACEVRENATCG